MGRGLGTSRKSSLLRAHRFAADCTAHLDDQPDHPAHPARIVAETVPRWTAGSEHAGAGVCAVGGIFRDHSRKRRAAAGISVLAVLLSCPSRPGVVLEWQAGSRKQESKGAKTQWLTGCGCSC